MLWFVGFYLAVGAMIAAIFIKVTNRKSLVQFLLTVVLWAVILFAVYLREMKFVRRAK